MEHTLVKLHGIETDRDVSFHGVAIEARKNDYAHGFQSTLGNFRKIISSYFLKPLKNQRFNVGNGEIVKSVVTDKKGNFSFESSREEGIAIASQFKSRYPVYFKTEGAELLVISDIDDTILHSDIKHPLKRILKLLLVKGQRRKSVNSTAQAFAALESESIRWFYVSRSESNLFPMIAEFILEQNLPKGPIFLRSFTNWKELLKGDREQEFKEIWIQWIADRIEHTPMIFFGDDSQHDLKVFTDFANRHSERVKGIFIRKTGRQNHKLQVDIIPSITHFYAEFPEIESIIMQIRSG